jgi:hypothetical protein
MSRWDEIKSEYEVKKQMKKEFFKNLVGKCFEYKERFDMDYSYLQIVGVVNETYLMGVEFRKDKNVTTDWFLIQYRWVYEDDLHSMNEIPPDELKTKVKPVMDKMGLRWK